MNENMRSRIIPVIFLITLVLVPVVCAEDALEWYTKGTSAAAAGNHDAAVEYFNNALSLDPNYESALAGKAASLNAKKNYAPALTSADAALKIKPQDPVALNARALALFGMGHYNESVIAYEKYFTVEQNRVEAYCNQGYAFLHLQKYDMAIIPYDRCTKIDPLNFMSWKYLGDAYMNLKKYDEALSAYDHATTITVTNATIWNDKGEALVALNKPVDAQQCFYKALGIDPNFNEAQKNKESMMGRQQIVNVTGTITPVPTISRIGTFYTTATPVLEPTLVTTTTEPPAPVETGIMTAKTPVAKRTTYSPVSLLTILSALGLAGCVALCLTRK